MSTRLGQCKFFSTFSPFIFYGLSADEPFENSRFLIRLEIRRKRGNENILCMASLSIHRVLLLCDQIQYDYIIHDCNLGMTPQPTEHFGVACIRSLVISEATDALARIAACLALHGSTELQAVAVSSDITIFFRLQCYHVATIPYSEPPCYSFIELHNTVPSNPYTVQRLQCLQLVRYWALFQTV